MPRKANPKIARALAKNTPPSKIAKQQGVALSTVYRAAERMAAMQAQTTAAPAKAQPKALPAPKGTAEAIPARSIIGSGPNFSGDALPGLRRFGSLIADDYDTIFRTVYRRTQLYREMGDDAVVAAVLQACKMTIRRATIYAETDGESAADQQAKDFLDECWNDMAQSGTDVIDQATNMLQYGFAAAEVVYKKRQGPQPDPLPSPREQDSTSDIASTGKASSKYNDGRIGWRRWTFMAPETLAPGREWLFDENGGIHGLRQMSPPRYEVKFIPIQKMVLFRTTAEKNNPEGRSILRAMYRSWYYKNNLEEVEAISAERMGAGFPVVYLGNGTARAGNAGDDLDTFKDIVRNVRVDDQMGMVIPYQKQDPATGNGVLFELVSPPSRGGTDFNQIITRHEQRMAMVGLAQFIHLGMGKVGAKAQNESSQDFFTLAVSAWLDSILDTLNRYAVERLFSLNYFPGLTTLPKLAHEAVVETDIDKVASYVNMLVGAEVLTPTEGLERYLLELADMPQDAKLTEMWDKKAALKEQQDQLGLQGQQVGVEGQQINNDMAKQAPKAMKPGIMNAKPKLETSSMDDPQLERLIAELKTTNEQLSATQGSGVTVENKFENVTMHLPENFAMQPAVPAQVVVNVPEQPAPVVHVAQPNIVLPAPIVNLPEGFGMQPTPNIVVNVPPAQVTVKATLEMPDTEAETTVEKDNAGRITKTRTSTRRAKK